MWLVRGQHPVLRRRGQPDRRVDRRVPGTVARRFPPGRHREAGTRREARVRSKDSQVASELIFQRAKRNLPHRPGPADGTAFGKDAGMNAHPSPHQRAQLLVGARVSTRHSRIAGSPKTSGPDNPGSSSRTTATCSRTPHPPTDVTGPSSAATPSPSTTDPSSSATPTPSTPTRHPPRRTSDNPQSGLPEMMSTRSGEYGL